MIKLIAIDMDDTFLDRNDRMPEANVEAVKALSEAGVMVIMNSGRTEVLMREHMRDLGIEQYPHVAVNGAVILNPLGTDNEIISSFDPEDYRKFIGILRDANRGFFCYHKDGLMYENADEKLLRHIERFHTMKKAVEGDCAGIDQCCRIAVVRNNEEEVPYLRSLAPRRTYATARPKGQCVSYMPDGLNKGTALEIIRKRYGFRKDEVASIGDQEVDTYMFKVSGLGIAVKNSDDRTKETADIVLPRTNNENAFAYAAYKYILKDEDKLKSI